VIPSIHNQEQHQVYTDYTEQDNKHTQKTKRANMTGYKDKNKQARRAHSS
jgi:hypothetical protein